MFSMSCQLRNFATFICLASISSTMMANIYNGTAPTGSKSAIGEGLLAITDVDYETKENFEFDLERTTLAFGYASTLASKWDVMFLAGINLDSEIGTNDGSGFVLGAGLKRIVLTKKTVTLSLWGGLSYARDNLDDLDVTVTEFHLGPNVSFAVNPDINIYGVLDLTVKSDGKADPDSSLVSSFSFERDNLISLRLGGQFMVDNMIMRLELALSGEDSLYFGIGAPI